MNLFEFSKEKNKTLWNLQLPYLRAVGTLPLIGAVKVILDGNSYKQNIRLFAGETIEIWGRKTFLLVIGSWEVVKLFRGASRTFQHIFDIGPDYASAASTPRECNLDS